MQETKFILQNKEKWSEFEGVLSKKDKNPDQLSESFIQLTDDLSYARTFYRNRSISIYLNNLAQKIFPSIYRNRRISLKRFFAIWSQDVPTAAWNSRKQLALSFLVFMLCFFIGILSSQEDSTFANQILGDQYVEMTKANIESGDPMNVYKNQSQGEMFLAIASNNLRVSFLTFIAGILFAMGSLLFIIYNGIMVGAFQHFFFSYEDWVIRESVLTIWQHGTIEISCIIIAGAAGMALGKGLLFPGSYSRMQSFRMSAFHGLILFIGFVPLIILAAFIESFVTRHTGVPDFIRIISIVLSFLFMVFYFGWLPYAKFRKNKLKIYPPVRHIPAKTITIASDTIKSGGEIFIDSFQFFKKNFGLFFRMIFFISAGFVVLAAFFLPESFFLSFFRTNNLGTLANIFRAFPLMQNLFQYSDFALLLVFMISTWLFISLRSGFGLNNFLKNENKPNKTILQSNYTLVVALINIGVLAFLMNIIVYNQQIFAWLCFLLFLPFAQLSSFIIISEKRNLFSAILRMFSLIKGSYGKVISLYLVYFLLAIGYFIVIFSPLLSLFTEFILLNINGSVLFITEFLVLFVSFFLILGFAMTMIFTNIGMGLLYFSLVETTEANALKKSISEIGLERHG